MAYIETQKLTVPNIMGRKLGAPDRHDNITYPVVLAGVRVTLDDVPGQQSGQVYDLVRPILSMRVENNGHREADTCEVTLNYLDFPFDARVVKDALITIWVDYVDYLLAPTTSVQPVAKILSKNAKVIFEGYADDYKTHWGNEGLEASFTCRDYTALLIDTKMMEGHFDVIRGNEKFGTIVKKLAEVFQLKVVFSEGLEAALPKVSEYFDDKDNRLVEEQSSYWDVILKLADMVGCICFVFGQKLYFGKPDPFKVYAAMYDATSRSAESITFVWGENVEELELCRKFGQNYKWTNVEIISYDTKKKRQVVAYWPKDVLQRRITQIDGKLESKIEGTAPAARTPFPAGRISKETPTPRAKRDKNGKIIPGTEPTRIARPALDGQGGGTVSTAGTSSEKAIRQVYRQFAPDNVPLSRLEEMAKGLWQQLGRNEITGKMKTAGNSELVVGNAFQIVLNHEHQKLVASYPDPNKRIEELIKRGYSKSMATQLARAFKEWDSQWWYIMTAVHTYNDDNGYDVDLDFISFANLDEAAASGASSSTPNKAPGSNVQPTVAKNQQQPPNRRVDTPPRRTGAARGITENSRLPVGAQAKNPQANQRLKTLRQQVVQATTSGDKDAVAKANAEIQRINQMGKFPGTSIGPRFSNTHIGPAPLPSAPSGTQGEIDPSQPRI